MAEVESADIIVGIPSYNSAATIGHVVSTVSAGLMEYFPGNKAVIINSDGGSTDGTPEIVQEVSLAHEAVLVSHAAYHVHKISFPYSGVPGKGSAIRAILEMANTLGAKACVVVDSDLRSITPRWIELLLSPVVKEGYDFVAPLYERHKFDGTITNSIVYPMTRALYGKRIRQPIGGEFGFSRKAVEFYLEQDVWHSDVARFGIDIWMTTEALVNGFKVCQAFLGAKVHDPKDPGADLGDMMVQVVGSLFGLAERHAEVWKTVSGSEEVPTFGTRHDVQLEHIKVNVEGMLGIFREGLQNLKEIWLDVIGGGDFGELETLGSLSSESFRFSRKLWTRIIYDFAVAYHEKKLPAQHLIRALLPLYLGKTASFVLEVADMDQEGAEAEIEGLCREFEGNKDYLMSRWQ